MPQISDILKNRESKAFTKKSYRSYDIEAQLQDNKNIIAINESDTRFDKKEIVVKETILTDASETESDNNQITIREQSGNCPVTIGEQPDNSQITIREHSENNQVTIGEQSGNKIPNNFRTDRLFEDPLDKLTQRKNPTEKYLELSGLQKHVTDLFVDICNKNNSTQTGSISSRAVAEHLKTTYGALKTTLVRLIKKEIIIREQGKSSKTGYINIKITSEVIESSNKYRNSNRISLIESDNNSGNHSDNKTIYNSSNITTSLLNGWESINFENLKEIGFTITQLKQLIPHNTPEIVQQSIDHFAYGLKHSDKTKGYTSPLNVFMGVLRKGEGWTEPGYKSQQEIAMEQYLENKKQNSKRLLELKEEIFNVEFSEWFTNIDSEEKSNIFNLFKLPANIKKSMSEQESIGLFKEYFKKNIFKDSEKKFI